MTTVAGDVSDDDDFKPTNNVLSSSDDDDMPPPKEPENSQDMSDPFDEAMKSHKRKMSGVTDSDSSDVKQKGSIPAHFAKYLILYSC